MLAKTKRWVLTSLAILVLLAAQCSVQPASVEEQSAATALAAAEGSPGPDVKLETLEPVSLPAGQRLRVVATTNIIADIVRNVGDDEIELVTLLPVGTDPHTFEATPRDVSSVAEADVVFVNGLGLEGFLGGLLKNAGGQATMVPVSVGVELRQFGAAEENAPGHTGEGFDPHVWLNPLNAIVFVHNIERALSALDPANADVFRAKAEAYEAQLKELDQWVEAQVESIPAENRQLVTDHDALGYYVDRYSLELVGVVIPAFSTTAEPSAQELAQLENEIKTNGVKAIFVGTTANPVLAQRLAEDTEIQLVRLYTDSLGPAGSGAETYLDYIRYNTTAIVEALK